MLITWEGIITTKSDKSIKVPPIVYTVRHIVVLYVRMIPWETICCVLDLEDYYNLHTDHYFHIFMLL